MKEIYSLLVKECTSDMPSILVVQKMVGVFEGLTHQFFVTKPNDSNVMLVFAEADIETMQENLLKYLEEYKTIDKSRLEYIVGLGIPLSHRKDIYQHATDVSKSLEIVCPQILAVPDGDEELGPNNAIRKTVFDESVVGMDIPVGDYILVRNRGRTRMVHAVVHELRHCWQHYKGGGDYYNQYTPNTYSTSDVISVAEQKEEIDAEAYASLYGEKKLGVPDGTTLLFDDGVPPKGWEGYAAKIKARMKEIAL